MRRTTQPETALKFSEQLYLFRTGKSWTQETLRTAVGVSRWTIIQWEKGNSLPNQNHILLLNRALGVDVRDWLPRDPPPSPARSQIVIKEIIIEAKRPQPLATLTPGRQEKENEYEFAS